MKNYKLILLGALFAPLTSSFAAVVNFTFTATISEPGAPFDGAVATGAVSYEDSLVLGTSGPLELSAANLDFEVTLLGQSFTELDDVSGGVFSPVFFVDGALSGLDFFVAEDMASLTALDNGSGAFLDNATPISEPALSGFRITADLSSGSSPFSAGVSTSSVPEPSSALLLAGAALVGFRRRR